MQVLNKTTHRNSDFFVAEGSRYPFSDAVRVGDTIYLAGQVGVGPDGVADDFETQSRQMMDNVARTLAGLGLDMEDLVKCTLFLKDIGQWQAFNKVYVEYFPSGRYPARSALGVDDLALGAQIEIECIARARQAA